jgi:hypothetical protein
VSHPASSFLELASTRDVIGYRQRRTLLSLSRLAMRPLGQSSEMCRRTDPLALEPLFAQRRLPLLTQIRLWLLALSRKADDDVRRYRARALYSDLLAFVPADSRPYRTTQTFLVMPNVIRAFSEMDCSKNIYWGTTAGGAYHFPRYMRGLGYALSWPLVSSTLRVLGSRVRDNRMD